MSNYAPAPKGLLQQEVSFSQYHNYLQTVRPQEIGDNLVRPRSILMEIDVVAGARVHHSSIFGVTVVLLCGLFQEAIAETVAEDVVEFSGDSQNGASIGAGICGTGEERQELGNGEGVLRCFCVGCSRFIIVRLLEVAL